MPLYKAVIDTCLEQGTSSFKIITHLHQIHFYIILPYRLDLPKDLFSSGLPTKTLYVFLDSYIRATCLIHSRLNLRFIIILGEEYNIK